ncbi:MAG TPA: type II toxin-antitoxin system HicB family antitoxin [Solirubrobacterales bacterium]|nr:type II toxin-antitoxin system HicB family antitoxin [Solirubrobacterales bacterium]
MAKVLVSLDDRLLKRIDRAAKASGESRSAYLARLAEDDAARGRGPGKEPGVRAALRRLERLFADAPATDSTAAVRAARDAR